MANVGDRVKVKRHHWARPGAFGTILGIDAKGGDDSERWVVGFDFAGRTGYVDEQYGTGKKCLNLQEIDFDVVP